jgi:hypothetical protein
MLAADEARPVHRARGQRLAPQADHHDLTRRVKQVIAE